MNGEPIKNNLIHDMDMLGWLFGPIADVSGFGSNAIRRAARTESGGVILHFASGVIMTIGFVDTTPTPSGVEAGTDESPAIPHTAQDSQRIAGTNGGIEFPSLPVWSGAESWTERPEPVVHQVAKGVPRIRQLEPFARVIAGLEVPLVTGEAGRAALDVIERIEAATCPNGVAA